MAISKDMTIQQIVGEHPEAVRVFFQHGPMALTRMCWWPF
jgi:hypothetical protein